MTQNSWASDTTCQVAKGGTGLATITSNTLLYGNGTSALGLLGPLTNGQLVVGSTGAAPVAASLTAPAAGLTITGGAGTITFALANDLSGLEGLSTTGVASRTGDGTWTTSSITQYAILYGAASSAVSNLGPLSNGQLVIGSTGNAPQAATLTAGSGITITPGAGSISISSSATNRVIQRVYTSTSALFTTTTTIPLDDTIPQKTEGDEILTLAITPTNASNVLEIKFSTFSNPSGGTATAAALFQDTTDNALASVFVSTGGSDTNFIGLQHTMVAGTTSATTFKIRVGPHTGVSAYFNGNGGSRVYGGVSSTTLTITEYSV